MIYYRVVFFSHGPKLTEVQFQKTLSLSEWIYGQFITIRIKFQSFAWKIQMKNNVKKITALTVNFLVLGSLTLINTSSYADENGEGWSLVN